MLAINKDHGVVNARFLLAMVMIGHLAGCVALPVGDNSPPDIPQLNCSPGLYSVLIPCTLTVVAADPESDLLAYQFCLEQDLGCTDWTDYYQSGEQTTFLLYLSGDEGVYSIFAHARDAMDKISGNSNSVLINFGNSIRLISNFGISGGGRKVVAENDIAFMSTTRNGLVVVDYSTPELPQVLGQTGSFTSDFIDKNGTAVFLLSTNAFFETIYAYDISDPGTLSPLGQLGINWAGNLDVENNYALVSAGRFGYMINLVDITDPANMVVLSTMETGPIIDIVLKYPYAFFISTGEDNFKVINYVNPNVPVVAASLDLQSYGPIYSGLYNYIYVSTYEGITIIDVSQPASPVVARVISVGGFCQDMHCSGSYLAMASSYFGVRLFDISDPIDPLLIGEYYDIGICTGVYCGDDYLFASDGWGGLLIFEYPARIANRERSRNNPKLNLLSIMRFKE